MRSGATLLCKIAHNWDIFDEEPGLDGARFDEPIYPMTLGNMRSLGVRRLFATCRYCGRELRSMSTPNHPRIRCTQTAIPTAITKNSGSATAKPAAFSSISTHPSRLGHEVSPHTFR